MRVKCKERATAEQTRAELKDGERSPAGPSPPVTSHPGLWGLPDLENVGAWGSGPPGPGPKEMLNTRKASGGGSLGSALLPGSAHCRVPAVQGTARACASSWLLSPFQLGRGGTVAGTPAGRCGLIRSLPPP